MLLSTVLSDIFRIRQKSYQMVLMLSILQEMNHQTGKALYLKVRERFASFYKEREAQGLAVEQPLKKMNTWNEATPAQFDEVLEKPIEVLSPYIEMTDTWLGFRPEIWGQLNSDALADLKRYSEQERDKELSKLWAKTFISLQEQFAEFMETYLVARTESRAQHETATILTKTIPEKLRLLPFILDRNVVQGSVGRPAWAKMPWIAIMDKRVADTTRQGYYICYIFAEDMKSVYLTLKHSDSPVKDEGKTTGLGMLYQKVKEIRGALPYDGFKTDDPVDYSHYEDWNYLFGVVAYKRYDFTNLPEDEELYTDLFKMIENYGKLVDGDLAVGEKVVGVTSYTHDDRAIKNTLQQVKQYIRANGFTYPDTLMENFYLSLKAKAFVILAGISGTGKTKLVKLFAEALGATQENGQFTLIPVRPDWSDPTDLIGYSDLSSKFLPGRLTEVLMNASQPENRDRPFFICLDEMNLARVEHYFSDLLSIMETQDWLEDEKGKRIITNRLISTSALCENDQNKYADLCIPDNVYIVGTVNMDETTHPFSKKVLDRANTIEFNYIDLNNLEGLNMSDLEQPDPIHAPNSFLRSDYLTLKDAAEHRELIEETTSKLVAINQILEKTHSHVGFRVRDAVCFYMSYNKRYGLLDPNRAFDIQFCQKILPRIQGSNHAVRGTLVELFNITTEKKYKVDELMDDQSSLSKHVFSSKYADFNDYLYPDSARKIAFMLRRLEEDGFTSFWLS